jgi:hypothetical protein
VLVGIGKKRNKILSLIDIKEAVPSAAPRAKDGKIYLVHADRVVEERVRSRHT